MNNETRKNDQLQQAYFKCAYECFDRNRKQEEVANCVEHCSVPVVNAQQHFEGEMAQFQVRYDFKLTKTAFFCLCTEKLATVILMQERMNRSLMVCQDKFEASKLHKNRVDATKAMESCVNTSIEDSLDTLPHIVQRMKTSFSITD